ncbi:hypothetical protein MBCUT_05190 [Methanobrevibacter cuticularis]|uniref:Antitoxin SocA-like Panacea domain-containing protein n=1 Tax=Methanobrevibacter cuticularis TaxID=47311 RepID=A0A166ELZ9_9EURY|nr:UPF0175 family protein [Methanobrevibacter cuticularis]KZX16800.1 hypothetical protein MBCUT_05190 [Methanobrevibacter cuticularis]
MEKRIKERILENIKENIGKKYILFLLNSLNQKPIVGKTILMKELFFIANNIPQLNEVFKFEGDNYGPNSDVVSRYLEDMSQIGLIKLENTSRNKDFFKYSLGNNGTEILNKTNTKELDTELLGDMKDLFDGLTTDEALALTYFSYPEMTEESLVKNKIEKKRQRLGLSLYEKGKVSVAKASKIADMPLDKFLELLKEKKIPMELLI